MRMGTISFRDLALAPEMGLDARFWVEVADRAGEGLTPAQAVASVKDEVATRKQRAHDLRRQATRLLEEAREVEAGMPFVPHNRHSLRKR